ncbi:MAG: amylo-alpha-1,6-glucosidase [Deltaproteobacteria bacterium]|nr:amylo-alpha-1,6-glucosidase [Deltaproteobacteria bacterium]
MSAPSPRIRIGDDYYLLAAALPARGRQLVLNHGDSFAIVTESGDCPLSGREPFGVCHAGTRFVDRFELRVNGVAPLLLSAEVTADGSEQISYLTNADERRGDELVAQRDTVALERRKALCDGTLFETLTAHNYGAVPFQLQLALLFAADFADIFELRGMERRRRGRRYAPRVVGSRVVTRYDGLDGVERRLELEFGDLAWRLDPDCASLTVRLPPGGDVRASVTARCVVEPLVGARTAPARRDTALAAVRAERARTAAQFPAITSTNALFDEWLSRSRSDLALLRHVGPHGDYLYAGVPWFATIFGRDGLLSGWETLAFAPEISAGVLCRLAATQGAREDPERDEAPGKILHELRHGEMAACGEVPFGRYYGSVDATPLFVALLAAYVERTADLEQARALWPAAEAASEWITSSLDARGYLSYLRRTPSGLANQGWKDSHDAISHCDGTLAEPPIALCEVQGYVYAALLGMAQLSERLGSGDADAWRAQARGLQERFVRDFWLADEGTYALALDAAGRPCRVVASNAGHCLATGIAAREHAAQVAARLMRNDCFCGWGIRTLAESARRYNPMSYHNGSVWPHDNALIAAGFARHGDAARAAELMTALFDASRQLPDCRLPELFCGFDRVQADRPVSYPVACRPQAWAAASVFLLLQAALGLSIDAWKRRVTFTRPCLPSWLDAIELRGLRVRDAHLDLRIMRGRRSAAIEVIGKDGAVDVLVRK